MHFEDDGAELTAKEMDLLDGIISAFGCYSGSILELMICSEMPWQEARGNLLPEDRSCAEISRETIRECFQQIIEAYQIINPCDIVHYSAAMRTRIESLFPR